MSGRRAGFLSNPSKKVFTSTKTCRKIGFRSKCVPRPILGQCVGFCSGSQQTSGGENEKIARKKKHKLEKKTEKGIFCQTWKTVGGHTKKCLCPPLDHTGNDGGVVFNGDRFPPSTSHFQTTLVIQNNFHPQRRSQVLEKSKEDGTLQGTCQRSSRVHQAGVRMSQQELCPCGRRPDRLQAGNPPPQLVRTPGELPP